jgi:hypothetical protein
MFCTGHMVLGTRLPMAQRERLAKLLGSAHHLFVLKVAAPRPAPSPPASGR